MDTRHKAGHGTKKCAIRLNLSTSLVRASLVRAVEIGSFLAALLKLKSPATASNARNAPSAADNNRSPCENLSGVAEKLSFAASSYTAHLIPHERVDNSRASSVALGVLI